MIQREISLNNVIKNIKVMNERNILVVSNVYINIIVIIKLPYLLNSNN